MYLSVPVAARRCLTPQNRLKTISFWNFWLPTQLCARTACTFSIFGCPKAVPTYGASTILACKCGSCHNSVHFSSLRPSVFNTFLLANVLGVTAACTFSFSAAQVPKVIWDRQLLKLFTSKRAERHNGVRSFDISTSNTGLNLSVFDTFYCASRHKGVQVFISHLASWLCTRRFSEPTFRPPGATNHWRKHTVSWPFLYFRAPASSLFWLSPFLIFCLSYLLSSDFLPLWASSWRCFSMCPYCRKF